MADYKKIAGNWTNDMNDFSFNEEKLVRAIANEHRTLQQNFTRVCFAWLRLCASEEYAQRTDPRNEASSAAAKAIADADEKLLTPSLPYV